MACKNGCRIECFMLDRGYCYEKIIAKCINKRKRDVFLHVYIVATVWNVHPIFNSRGPRKLGFSASSTPNKEIVDGLKFGKHLCLYVEQCALGGQDESCGRKVLSTVLQEVGINQSGMTMISTDANLIFSNCHVIYAPSHSLVKTRRAGIFEFISRIWRLHYLEGIRDLST